MAQTSTPDARLARLRGPVAPRRHNARTIAALTGNPGCTRRAVLDGAGVDKMRVAEHIGFPGRFGQSSFAIVRGNVFEARLKANEGAELVGLLGVDVPKYLDLSGGPKASNEERYARTLEALRDNPDTLLDHPMLRLEVAGRRVYLEPDLVAFQLDDRYHVVEIKSFPVIDEQADPGKVSAAATQAAVYVLALREALAEAGRDPESVSHEVLLVCPKDFSNQPIASMIDVRRQLGVLRRQLSRMAGIDALLDTLPDGISFDLEAGEDGEPARAPEELAADVAAVPARYAPDCLATCELSFFCRSEARTSTAVLGRSVREELGGIEDVQTVLALASGRIEPEPEQAEAAAMLQAAYRLRQELVP